MRDLSAALQQRRAQHLYRRRATVETPQGVRLRIDGQDCVSFCSNDYLGLANHPEVVRAFQEGVERFGVGSGAAHLITGHGYAHQALEEDLAAFTGRPRALLFSTGYQANLGVLAALAGRGDRVFEDRLNHASLLDGARLAGARLLRYRHRDAAALQARLESAGSGGERVIATDAVFSMDGDQADLAALYRLAQQYEAWLLVDDAHGFGVLGDGGRGAFVDQLPGAGDTAVLMATLGKACGTFGAFVAGGEALVETLIQEARTYIYTTAPPPALAWATRTALRLLAAADERRAALVALVERFRAGAAQLGLPLMESSTPIQPLLTGSAARALACSEALRARGLLVTAIRPPTVPEGSARLRITFSAQHEADHVDRLLDALGDVLGQSDEPAGR